MSQRGDRGEGHARRPGRSSSFGGHRGGGVGSAGKGGAGSSGQPPLSSNRSFRKPGNGHGGHQRVVNQPDTTGFQPAPAPDPHQTPARPPPAPQNAAVHVPISVPRPQHQDPQVSSSLSASENPANPPLPKATHAAPRAPPKSNPPLPQGGSKDLLSEGFTTIVWPRRIPGFNACLARVIPAPRPRTASASRSPSSTRSRSARPLREFLDQANSVHAAGSCAAVEYRERGVFNASKMLAQI